MRPEHYQPQHRIVKPWSQVRKLRFTRTICLAFILASAPQAVLTYWIR